MAVNGISLEIARGGCFGLLGPNGAGKSTFIGMTYGAIRRTSGDLQIFGKDPNSESLEIKKRLGVVTQENALDESLTVIENMLLYAAFLGIPQTKRRTRVNELLEYMSLEHKRDAPIRALSGGMKRRLTFVRALLGKPDLLILDEPTTGLDPSVRHLIWGKVKELREGGTSVLLTTHYMYEAEVLCDRLVILNQGAIVADGTPSELIKAHAPGYIGIYHLDDREQVELVAYQNNLAVTQDSSGVYLRAFGIDVLTQLQQESGLEPLQIRPSNLEDVFLKLTGREMAIDA